MATSVADAEAMVAAQQESGKKLMVNFANRWMHSFAQTKDALEAGELGAPLLLCTAEQHAFRTHADAIMGQQYPTAFLAYLSPL